MDRIEFNHEGVTYSVGALTGFQESLVGLLFTGIGKDLFGSWDDTPSMQKQLMVYFGRWNLATRIDGVAFNFLDATPERYQDFCQQIAEDNELASKWMSAYEAANLEQTDPNESNAEPEPANE